MKLCDWQYPSTSLQFASSRRSICSLALQPMAAACMRLDRKIRIYSHVTPKSRLRREIGLVSLYGKAARTAALETRQMTLIHNVHVHCVSKTTALACYNFDVHQLIFIMFSRNVTRKQAAKLWLIFPLHLSNTSALPGKHRNSKIASFHLVHYNVLSLLFQSSTSRCLSSSILLTCNS